MKARRTPSSKYGVSVKVSRKDAVEAIRISTTTKTRRVEVAKALHSQVVTESMACFFPDMCQHYTEFQIVDSTCLLASSHIPSGLHSRLKAVVRCVTRCFLAATSSPGRDVFRSTIAPSPGQLCQAYAASPRILKCNRQRKTAHQTSSRVHNPAGKPTSSKSSSPTTRRLIPPPTQQQPQYTRPPKIPPIAIRDPRP